MESIPLTGFVERLGCRVISVGGGTAQVELTVGPEHLNPSGTVHGGVYCSLADLALSLAVLGLLADRRPVRLVEMKVNLLRSVVSGVLRAEGHIRHRGRSSYYGEARLSNELGEDVAYATGTVVVPGGGAQ